MLSIARRISLLGFSRLAQRSLTFPGPFFMVRLLGQVGGVVDCQETDRQHSLLFVDASRRAYSCCHRRGVLFSPSEYRDPVAGNN